MRYVERKQILFLGVTILAGVVLVMFGYIPIAWQKYVIRQALQRQTLTAEQIYDNIKRASVLEKQIAELEPLAARFNYCVPRDTQFASLWRQIADLMTHHELQNQEVRPGAEYRYKDFNSVSLDIQCTGTLPKIFDFVRSLEQMDRLVRIEQMELKNDKNLTGQLSFSAKAQVFYETPQNYKSG